MRRARRDDRAPKPDACAALLRQLAAKPVERLVASPTKFKTSQASGHCSRRPRSRSASSSDDKWPDVDQHEYRRVVADGKRLMRNWTSGADYSTPQRHELEHSARPPLAVEVADVSLLGSDMVLGSSIVGNCQGGQGYLQLEDLARESAATSAEELAAKRVDEFGPPLSLRAPSERAGLDLGGTQVSETRSGLLPVAGTARDSLVDCVGNEFYPLEVLTCFRSTGSSLKRRRIA